MNSYIKSCIILFTVAFILSAAVTSLFASDYKRGEFGEGWIDADNDGQDTRQEVLIEESLIPVTFDKTGNTVVKGLWLCPYTNKLFTNPKMLDIDHMVALKEAWLSGADKWSKQQRIQYANDLSFKNHLIAVYRGANRSKGAKDPLDWMPENKQYHLQYMLNWIIIKERYGLSYTDGENLGYFEDFFQNKKDE